MSIFIDHDGEKADKALKLREEHGLSYALIAERLGVKPGNIHGMLQRAKQRKVNKILERTAETAEKVRG